jgi:HD-GYP domain-containing protein (c-di-GMP phosphodiesterase class II)
VASYAALLALQAGLESIEEMMLASMISELGILFVHPTVTRKIREDRMCDLTAEERMEFENYPLKSLNLVLDRKLQIEEKLRNLVLTMHSRADGKGYPRGGTGGAHKKMTLESQFLGLAYELDRLSLVRLGQPRPNPELVLRRILDEEKKRPARFGLDFTLRVEEAIG